MTQFFIFEGIDGAGKTTLVDRFYQNLVDDGLFVQRVAHKQPDGDPVAEYLRPFQYAYSDENAVLIDRSYPSENIYGPIYRGKGLSEGETEYLERVHRNLNVIFVHVEPPLDVVRKRLESRGEDFLEDSHVDQVYQAYRDFFSSTRNMYISVNTDDEENTDAVLRSLHKFVNSEPR